MCFPSTTSEIVVPIAGETWVIGRIDIDSDKLAAFTPADKELLERGRRTPSPLLGRTGDSQEEWLVEMD